MMSNYLAERRKQLGYTQKEIASMVNVSEGKVAKSQICAETESTYTLRL